MYFLNMSEDNLDKCALSHRIIHIKMCHIQVVWKRVDAPHVLTVGEFAFVSDPKFSVKHIPFKEEL